MNILGTWTYYERDISFKTDNGCYKGVFNSDELKDYIILNDMQTKPTPKVTKDSMVHGESVAKMKFSDKFPDKHHILGPMWRPEEPNV